MKSLAVFHALVLVGAIGHAQEADDVKPAVPPPIPASLRPSATGLNPALLYWQAIGMLPDLESEQVKLIPQVLGGKLSASDGQVNDLLILAKRSMERFSRAAAVENQPCVWGTTFDEGPFAPMPHLPKFQTLCRLTLIQAEALFEQGRNAQALEALLTVHHAARHVASDALLVTILMQHGMEQQTLRLTGKHVLALDATIRARHLAAMQKLPPLRPLKESLQVEHHISEWLRHSVIGIENAPESEDALLKMSEALLHAQSQNSSAAASQAAKESLASLAEYKLSAEQAHAVQGRLEGICELPWTVFQTEMGKVHADFVQAPAALRSMLSGVAGARRKELESATLQTMLKASLELGQTLTSENVAVYKDAFLDAPLQISRSDEGLVLACRDAVNGKLLELRL